MDLLTRLLEEKGVLLADGATGTNLFDMGLTSGNSPEFWNDEKPENIRKLHQDFVDAGSDIILTNTFGCNPHRLKLHNAQDRVFELNEKAAQIARDVAENAERPVVVAGSVGPTGELLVPLGALTKEEAKQAFVEQMEGLKAGGADVFWIETMSAVDEIEAAAQAAVEVGLPYVVTASFDTAGKTMMGLAPANMPAMLASQDRAPLAVGANCGVGASDLLSSVLDMTAADPSAIVIAKANCGIPEIRGENVVYTGTPELMADYTKLAMDAGARIIGGCCGTSCNHLRYMRKALDEHLAVEKPQRPTVEEIVEKIGPMKNATSSANDETPRRERRGKRRA
ncbi:betaine--homocysteine S-methyltransferase [Salaquimonas pukyongi]|uniref:betaine--homocysteine S-methyltransferase n=1 Tax=Salaquimonas pukyongi TaxID=2712698 RepID=UPI00096B9018|nr:betaine--homocysteine S-methyltransferase [Salaquimonas pukyongi]